MRERTSALQKNVGDEELVFGTITDVSLNKSGTGTITWKHVTSGRVVVHDITSDKLTYDNCYGNVDVGGVYVIVQELVTKARGGRWVWTGCVLVTVKEAQWVFEKCGYKNIDFELFDDVMDVLRTKRKKARQRKLVDSLLD